MHFNPEELKHNFSILNLLNDKDRDILYLIFVSKKKQKEVQKILGRSQPSLCYDIRRIRERVRFIVYLKQVFDIYMDFLERNKEEYEPLMLQTLTLMYYTTSFTLTAKVLGCHQMLVRSLFEKALRRMKALQHWEVYEIFSAINHNKNKIRRIYHQRRKER